MKTPEQELEEIGGEPLDGSGFEAEDAVKSDAFINGEPVGINDAATFLADAISKGNLTILQNEVSPVIAPEPPQPAKP